MKTLLSIFDYSGTWSMPFEDNGWNVIRWDIKLAEFMDLNLIDSAEIALETFEDIDGIIAAVPCTDFASSGARWFKQKDQDGTTKASIELVNKVVYLIDLFKPTDIDWYDEPDNVFFWAIENPVGRIKTLFPELGDAYYFHPWEFAEYVTTSPFELEELDRIRKKNGKRITRSEREFVISCNAYTKKTGLWGEFNRNLVKMPIQPVKCNPYGSPMMSYGGKSSRTKENRSITPEGFAQAFYEANKSWKTS